MQLVKYYVAVSLCVCTNVLSAQEDVSRDPFAPFLSGAAESVSNAVLDGVQATPLKKYPAEKYILSGIISSKKNSVALIKTPEGESFLMFEGDQLGADDFKIDVIDGLRVELKNIDEDRIIKRVANNGDVSDES